MDLNEQIDKEFSQLAALPDDRIDLARGALLIAKTAYPDLDESLYLERLNRTASKLKSDMAANDNVVANITLINHLLFDEEKLSGNREDYYDPDNSFLNRVLDRKLGIPITLTLVYIEVTKRLGMDVHGIGLPGHFIAAVYDASGIIYIDPFNRGEIRTVDDCRQIVRTHLGENSTFDPRWLKPVSNKEFLARILRNLKLIYAQTDHDIMLFRIICWILDLQPDAPAELRARAILYEAMGNPGRAIKDWERYLANASDLEDETMVRAKIADLKTQKPRIH